MDANGTRTIKRRKLGAVNDHKLRKTELLARTGKGGGSNDGTVPSANRCMSQADYVGALGFGLRTPLRVGARID